MRDSGVRSGVMYPMLARMVADGWLDETWENPVEITASRPPRRHYALTDLGWQECAKLAEEQAAA